ncbi:MAG: IS5 family transposase [Planctomycetota bacterium]
MRHRLALKRCDGTIKQRATLADGQLADLGGPRTAGLLERLDAATPWDQLAQVVRPLYCNDTAKGGRPNVPIIVMLKLTLMQRWFGLSDPAMEEAVLDRLSFRRFLGLGVDDPGIDHATIALFRKRLHDAGLAGELFDLVNAHLRDKGLIVGEGTSVDATIIEAPRRRKSRKDDLEHRKQEPEATHTKKRGQIHHGYKAHVAGDKNAMVTDYRLDTAKVYDINHFEDLTKDEPDGGKVYADAAYRGTKRRKKLEDRGVLYGVMHKRVRGQSELTAEQKAHNRLCAGVRGLCEMPFAWLLKAGRKRTRYRGLRKLGTDFGLWATGYNLWRSLSIMLA